MFERLVGLLVLQQYSEVQSPPVENVSRGEDCMVSVPLDLTGRLHVVPHVDIRQQANERLLPVEKPAKLNLLLKQENAFSNRIPSCFWVLN